MTNLTTRLWSYDFTIMPENTKTSLIKKTIQSRIKTMAEKPSSVGIVFGKSLPEKKIKGIPKTINGVKINAHYPKTGNFTHEEIVNEAKKLNTENVYIISDHPIDDASPLSKLLYKVFDRPNISA